MAASWPSCSFPAPEKGPGRSRTWAIVRVCLRFSSLQSSQQAYCKLERLLWVHFIRSWFEQSIRGSFEELFRVASKQSLPQTRTPKYNEYLQGSGSRLRMFYFLFSVRLAGYDEPSNYLLSNTSRFLKGRIYLPLISSYRLGQKSLKGSQ